MATDTAVNNLIINKMTKAQYDALENPSETELYLVPDYGPIHLALISSVTDARILARWEEMMAEAQEKGYQNVSPWSYFVGFSHLNGLGEWECFSYGHIESGCTSVRFGDWVIERSGNELVINYRD